MLRIRPHLWIHPPAAGRGCHTAGTAPRRWLVLAALLGGALAVPAQAAPATAPQPPPGLGAPRAQTGTPPRPPPFGGPGPRCADETPPAADQEDPTKPRRGEAEEEPETIESPGAALKRIEIGLSLPTTTAETYQAVPDESYRLGPYDKLEVSLDGLKPERWEVAISPQGNLALPLVGAMRAAGLTVRELERALVARLKRYYRDFTVSVTVAELRGIQVTVSGQVMAPGSYSAPGLMPVWQAIQMAGGITEAGSVRRVRIRSRDGNERTVDLYPFLFAAADADNCALETGDTVVVPVAERIVGLAGEVRRPGLYEFREGESLADLLALAGGATAQAALDKAYIERALPQQTRQVVRVDLSGAAAAPSPELRDGDILVIPALSVFMGQVRVEGEVRVPGAYERKQNMRLRDLLEMAGGCKGTAALAHTYVERYEGNAKPRYIWVDAAQALAGDDQANLLLAEGDVVHVPPVARLAGSVEVTGEVREPVRAPLGEGMRISDLVRLAGGTTANAALEQARLIRVNPEGIREASTVNLGPVVANPGGPEDLALRDGDTLLVPSISVLQKTVRVVGELVGTGIFETVQDVSGTLVVKRRGTYELNEGDTLRDLIYAVGGCTANANLRAARIERRTADGKTERLPVDLHRLLVEKDESANVALQNGDEFIVPAIADMVYVVGAVNRPGAYDYREGNNRVIDMLNRAGGYTQRARLSDVRLIHSDAGPEQKPIRVDMNAVLRRGRVEQDPGVRPGDIIFVPEKIVTYRDIMQALATVPLLSYYFR